MIRKLFKRFQEPMCQDDPITNADVKCDALRLMSGEAVEVQIHFRYSLLENEKKWVDIVALKKSDKEAAFVFRVNQKDGFFQIYFGDGAKVHGELKIDTHSFLGRETTLKYVRSRDITIASLECSETKEVRIAVHRGAIAAAVSSDSYSEGNAESGVLISRVELFKVDGSEASLEIAEALVADTRAERSTGYYRSLNALGTAYFQLKEYGRALDIFESVSKVSCSNINQLSFTLARSCINNIYNASDREAAWARFSSPEDRLFGQARMALMNNRGPDVALTAFSEAVKRVFGGPVYQFTEDKQARLITAFRTLVDTEDQDGKELLSFRAANIAIVSGMGWSGSGAVYDYLREFGDVVAIRGETPYIEGSESLRTIYSSLGDTQELKERVLDFFFYALIGHGQVRDAGDFKLFKHARRNFFGEKCDQYLETLNGWCLLAQSVCVATSQERYRRFLKLSDYTVNKFSINRKVPEGKVALLDNVVHIGNAAECINFLSNVTIFCTFRDPRSNYVALIREAGHFTSSVREFISSQKDRIPRVFQTAQAAKVTASTMEGKTVEIVNFERFVFSEKYRKNLADKLGLALDKQSKYKYFKPWESMRNVILHQEHPDQEEIKLIEDELGQYCYEPCIRPLRDEISNTGERSVI